MSVRIPPVVRNTVVSILALLVLFVVAGVGYTWYSGQSSSTHAVVTAPASSHDAEPVIKPVKPAANAKESVAIESLTTPVAPGANASVIVRTLADSKCTISVVYNGVPSKDSGLVAKTADVYGTVSWSWTVGDEVSVGHTPVTVNCTHNKQSAMVQGDLVVTK